MIAWSEYSPGICSPENKPCYISQSQNEMNQQAENNFKKADAELNRVYNQFIDMLKGKDKEVLINSQLTWIKFRDSNCEFWARQCFGGSLYPLLYFGKKIEMTKARTAELKDAIKEFTGVEIR